LDWPQARLGAESNVSEGTVRDFENGKRIPTTDRLVAMQVALELAGVTLLGDGETGQGGGPGVRLRSPTPARTLVRDGEAGIIENSEM
jgi:transcriptional regulator with XRE-family HTH domain